MKKLILILIIFTFIPVVYSIEFVSDFNQRQQYNLTANYTIFDSRFTNMVNFTAFLNFSTNDLISEGALKSDCSDLTVTDIDNNELNFEIERETCNAALGTVIFIRYPSLVRQDPNSIYVYYNSTTATAKSDSFIQDTWDKRYKLVAHIHNGSFFNSVNFNVIGSAIGASFFESQDNDMPLGNYINFSADSSLSTGINFPSNGQASDNSTNVSFEVIYFGAAEISSGGANWAIIGGRDGGFARTHGIVGNSIPQLRAFVGDKNDAQTDKLVEAFSLETLRYATFSYFFPISSPQTMRLVSSTGLIGEELTISAGVEFPSAITLNEPNIPSGRYRGGVDEVRISFNFSQTQSREYAEMNSNLYLSNERFWTAGAEESAPPPAPSPITAQAVLPLENVSNLVGMVTLLLIILAVIFGARGFGAKK